MENDYIFKDVAGMDIRLEDFDAESTDIVFEYSTDSDETVSVELEDIDVEDIADVLSPDSVEGHEHGLDFFESPIGRDRDRYDMTVHRGADVISVSGLDRESFLSGYTRPDRFYSVVADPGELERELARNFGMEVKDSEGHSISSNNIGRWGSFTGVLQADNSRLYLAEPGASRGARVEYDGEGLEDHAGEEIKLYGGLKGEGFEESAVGEFFLDTITYEEV